MQGTLIARPSGVSTPAATTHDATWMAVDGTWTCCQGCKVGMIHKTLRTWSLHRVHEMASNSYTSTSAQFLRTLTSMKASTIMAMRKLKRMKTMRTM